MTADYITMGKDVEEAHYSGRNPTNRIKAHYYILLAEYHAWNKLFL